jgi:uncharacterized paraquat-inducible protein A
MKSKRKIWIKAWIEVAASSNCVDVKTPTKYADQLLNDLDERFYCQKIESNEDLFGTNVKLDVTSCCKIGPIVDENYCPNCGKKIKHEK